MAPPACESLANRIAQLEAFRVGESKMCWPFFPLATVIKVYPFVQEMAKTTLMFDVLLADDRLLFPNHASNR